MTTNQTIDGVPRDDLELVLLHGHSTHESDQAWDRLRALLDAPAYPNRLCHVDYTAHPYICGCLKGDEEAQRRYDEKFGKATAQPRGEPVAWFVQWNSILPGITGHREVVLVQPFFSPGAATVTPLYAEQPAPAAVDEANEFSRWTHEVIAESRVGGVTIKIQRMQHLTPSEEKAAHDAWMARAALNTKSR